MASRTRFHGDKMDVFQNVDSATKSLIVERWKHMSEIDKTHFINQVSLALSVWGSDDAGRRIVVDVLKEMVSNGSSTLADFGLYVDKFFDENKVEGEIKPKVKRASLILDGYRIKNALPSEPHKELEI